MYLKRYQACIPSPLLTVRFRPPSNRSFPFKSFTSMHLHTLSARRNTSTILFSTSSALFLPSRRVWGCSPPSTQAYLSLDFSCPLSTLNCSPNAKGRWSMSTSPPTPLQSTVTKNPGGWVSGIRPSAHGRPHKPRDSHGFLAATSAFSASAFIPTRSGRYPLSFPVDCLPRVSSAKGQPLPSLLRHLITSLLHLLPTGTNRRFRR